MPKIGFTNVTVKVEDIERLLGAARDILVDSPIKAQSLSPAEQLRLLLDEHDKHNQEPEEES